MSYDHINLAIGRMTVAVYEFNNNDESADTPTGDLEAAITCALYDIIEHSKDGHPESDRVQELCDNLSKIEDSKFFEASKFIESLLMKLNKTFNDRFEIFFQLKKGEDGKNTICFW